MPGEDDGQRLGRNDRLVPGEDDGRLALGDERPAAWRLGGRRAAPTEDDGEEDEPPPGIHWEPLGRPGLRLGSCWGLAWRGPATVWEQAREDTAAATIPHADLISLKAATTNRYVYKAGANAGYSEGDSAQQEARAGLEAGESDPAGATATARR